MSNEKVEQALRSIEKIIDDFVLEFEMIGLLLVDRQGRVITTRNVSDLFDSAKLLKMITALYPEIPSLAPHCQATNFSWLIFQNEEKSLLVHPVGENVVMGMLVDNEISLTFYKQQVIDLVYRLDLNFRNLYEGLQEE